MKESSTLYVVATPIGNLQDVTARALETLKAVDIIAAEDTRVTQRLLQHYGISKRLLSLNGHNEGQRVNVVVEHLAEGRSVALVSDAGTPAISDPGAAMVAAVRAAGYRAVPIPGPSALAAALSVAGLQEPGFLFLGFLPARSGERRATLTGLREFAYPIVLYEAPHRVMECVADLADIMAGARTLIIARELTKVFESVHSVPLKEAPTWLAQDDNRRRGEFVLIVSGATADLAKTPAYEEALRVLMAELPLKQAVQLTAKITGAPRNDIYARALELKSASG